MNNLRFVVLYVAGFISHLVVLGISCMLKINKERKCLKWNRAQIIYSHNFGSFTFNITTSVITQWVIILVLGIGSFLLTRNLKLKPGKLQAALEKLYQMIYNLVENTMGSVYLSFLPYIGTLMVYLLVLNFLGLIGF